MEYTACPDASKITKITVVIVKVLLQIQNTPLICTLSCVAKNEYFQVILSKT